MNILLGPVNANGMAYGTERSYNGLCLANDSTHITVFLMADAVNCAKKKGKKYLKDFTASN